jgi:hypothetical protein
MLLLQTASRAIIKAGSFVSTRAAGSPAAGWLRWEWAPEVARLGVAAVVLVYVRRAALQPMAYLAEIE